jgi:DNA-binding beta-propeller fold protein YncE
MRAEWMRLAVCTTLLLTCGSLLSLAEERQDLILSANLDGTSVQTTLELSGFCGGIALDRDAGKIYFTELGLDQAVPSDRVLRANLDGSNIENLIEVPDHESTYAIALDPADGKVYWTDTRSRAVHRANLDGSNIETLISEENRYWSMALDLQNRKMYLGQISSIDRADLDGSNLERVLYNYNSNHFGIALDVANGKMYWTEMSHGNIKRANLDGSAKEILVRDLSNPRAIALDLAQGKMYWANLSSFGVRRANMDGSDVEILIYGESPMHAIDLDPGRGKLYVSTFIIDETVVPAASETGAMILALLILLGATALLLRRACATGQ